MPRLCRFATPAGLRSWLPRQLRRARSRSEPGCKQRDYEGEVPHVVEGEIRLVVCEDDGTWCLSNGREVLGDMVPVKLG